MAHGILTGIGFLGAGVIFREGPSVQGLTTAASLWMAAALGVLYGVGMYGLALAGAAATLAVLIVLRLFYAVLPVRVEVRLRVVADGRSEFSASALRDLLRGQNLAVRAVSQSLNTETNHMEFTSTTRFQHGEQGDRLAAALKSSPGVLGFAVIPLEDDAAHGTSWLALSSDHGGRPVT
jgi:putative Mg2+ transporter-C (MgtC) family protein